ncbi:MAG: hypothetical protein J6X02_00185 [Bacilli bacterium]|nr:hypothetical protein [Bacilli bacterium]
MKKISDNKRKNINRAHELVMKCINNKKASYMIDDYYTLQISKFLLLKESIIKKNPRTNTIYFNYGKNIEYLKPIKKIVKYLSEHGVIINNDINVVITPKEYETEKLKYIILTFHKLRDAIAHGEYEIDTKNETIIINNLDPKNSEYKMHCVIPISLLEEFTYCGIPENIMNILIKNEKEIFKVNVRKDVIKRNKTGFQIVKDNPYNNLIYNNYMTINKIYDNNLHNINNLYYNKDILNYDDKKISKSYQYESSLKVIKTLLDYIKNSKTISPETKKKAIQLAKKILDNPKYYKALEGLEKDIEYLKKIQDLIDDLCKILNIDNGINSIKHIAIYNYVQMYLSNCLDNEDVELKEKIKYIRTSKLKVSFLTNKNDTNNPDIKIIRKVRDIIKHYKKLMLQCKNNPNSTNNDYQKIILGFYNASQELFSLIEERNQSIITSIRNAIDHGNIKLDDDNITLNDTNDIENDKFSCSTTTEDLFMIINDLDTTDISNLRYDELSIICTEIEPIFHDDKELYNDFYEAVRLYYRMRVINQLKEIEAKK